jgi:hypothetical protein
MRHKVDVLKLLSTSEARTGNRVGFIVGPPLGNKMGHVLISVWVADADLEVDLVGGITPAKEKLILNWFEPLAKAHQSALGA